MSKNFFNKLKESFMSSPNYRGNKSDDFEKAKEVLFSSKNTQQLISAVKFINNFNKKWDIREGSPEFIYFERMIKLMRIKIKNIGLGNVGDLDESFRLSRSIKNIIRESLGDLSWIEDTHSSFDPHFIFKGKEHWVDVEGLSNEEKILIREYLLKVTNYRSSRQFKEHMIDEYKGFVVHCGTDVTDYEPEEDEICYLEVSFNEDKYTDNSIYVDGREVLEYINLTNDDEELDESLEWTDKDNSYGNDERYSNDGSWKADDNWTPNPDKSYWKQGSVGSTSSSGGESVSEGIDDLGWIKDIEEFPNYNGFPQGVVYVGSHEEITMFYELIQKINPKNFDGRGNIYNLHQGLEERRDEAEAEGYDSSDSLIAISFFVEKDYPEGLSTGYWSYDVDEDEINEWLSGGDTFSQDYRLYNSVYNLKKELAHLIN
jgi:hypothetical protein